MSIPDKMAAMRKRGVGAEMDALPKARAPEGDPFFAHLGPNMRELLGEMIERKLLRQPFFARDLIASAEKATGIAISPTTEPEVAAVQWLAALKLK